MTTALVIGRRRPGRPIGKAIRDTERLLVEAGWTVEHALVRRKRDLRRRVKGAVEASVDVVVAVGGDGAVLQAVQRVAGGTVALGIVPMGTGNLLATNLGIPRPLPEAVKVLVANQRRTIDLGELTVGGKQRLFSVACGIGLDARIMQATRMRDKQRWGKLAYAVAAVRESRSLRDVQHRLEVDGKRTTMSAAQVLIANFGGAGLGVEPRLPIKPDDGYLDVIAIRAADRSQGILAIWDALRQRQAGRSANGRVLRTRGRTIEIHSKAKRLVEIDGSVIGTTPIAITVRPAALIVIAAWPTASGEPPSG